MCAGIMCNHLQGKIKSSLAQNDPNTNKIKQK